jgi:hypothetical protein
MVQCLVSRYRKLEIHMDDSPLLPSPPLRSILCVVRRFRTVPEQPHMIRFIFACYLLLFCLGLGMFAQVGKGQQPPAAPPTIDSEYRKFDEL